MVPLLTDTRGLLLAGEHGGEVYLDDDNSVDIQQHV